MTAVSVKRSKILHLKVAPYLSQLPEGIFPLWGQRNGAAKSPKASSVLLTCDQPVILPFWLEGEAGDTYFPFPLQMLRTIGTKRLKTNGKFLVELTEFIYDKRYNIPLVYFLIFFSFNFIFGCNSFNLFNLSV